MPSLLEVRNLVKHFPIKGSSAVVQAINGVTFSVEAGQTLGLIGESGSDLERLFRDAGLQRTERAATLDEAVGRADAIAREALASTSDAAPATVLLSPAAASFDMFRDYAARGRAFKDAVADLIASRARSRSRPAHCRCGRAAR